MLSFKNTIIAAIYFGRPVETYIEERRGNKYYIWVRVESNKGISERKNIVDIFFPILFFLLDFLNCYSMQGMTPNNTNIHNNTLDGHYNFVCKVIT